MVLFKLRIKIQAFTHYGKIDSKKFLGRSDSVKLKIVTINHGTFEITEPLTTSIGEVKLRIGDILHKQGTFFEPSFQRLLMNGEELSRNEQLLGQINMIGHEATIHLHELQNHPDSDLPNAERFLVI